MKQIKEYVKIPGKYKFQLDEISIDDRIQREREFNKKPRYAGGYSTPPPPKEYKSSIKNRYDYNERRFISTNIKTKQDILSNLGYDLETGEEDPTKAPTPRELSKMKTHQKRLSYKKKLSTTEKTSLKNIRTFLRDLNKNSEKFNKLKREYKGKENEMSKFIKKHKKESILDNKNEIRMPSLFEDNDNIVLNLTKKEARGLLSCLIRTSAKGEDLTIGMKIEDRLVELLK